MKRGNLKEPTISFEVRLQTVQGKILKVYLDDLQHRMTHGLLYYFDKADTLRKSAEILMTHGETREVFTMLSGMAIELLLKGIQVGLDLRPSKSHNLSILVDDVGISVDDDQRILLEVLTEHIIWVGRYTTPMNKLDWDHVAEIRAKQRHGGSKWLDNPSRTLDIGTFRRLWGEIAGCFCQVKEARLESAASTIEDRLLDRLP
jgi:HEPN domain-containing protein